MSFFDDDEPIRASRTRPARPRTPAPARTGGGSGGSRRPPSRGTRAPDPADVRRRQLILVGAAVVIFVILVLLVSSCQSSRKERALKDYNQQVTQIASDSDKLGQDFFAALNSTASGASVATRVNALTADADALVKRANALKPRDEVARAQYALELAMNLRAQGISKIAKKLPTALAQGRDNAQSVETALGQIAGQMQQFVGSDVIYSQRVAPYINEALRDANIDGQRVVTSQFLKNYGWLNKNQVGKALNAQRAGGGVGESSAPAPGLHGHSLTSVSVGSKTLQPGTVTNMVAARPAPVFTVRFANGGDNNERSVAVTARITGISGRNIPTRKKVVNQTTAKSDATASISLGVVPPTGGATLTITIAKVPGEQETGNNKQSYTILFTG